MQGLGLQESERRRTGRGGHGCAVVAREEVRGYGQVSDGFLDDRSRTGRGASLAGGSADAAPTGAGVV